MAKLGIKNTLEVIDLIEVISVEVIKEMKRDGFQPTDLVSFFKRPDFAQKLVDAAKEIDLVDDECKDLNWEEIYSLGKEFYELGNKIIDELKS